MEGNPSSTGSPPQPNDAERAAIASAVTRLIAKLMRLVSVVDSAGEAGVAPMLQQHIEAALAGAGNVHSELIDSGKANGAHSLLAFLPCRSETENCLVLMGHFDTVGLEPYGPLSPQALDSAALKLFYGDSKDPLLAKHSASSEWAFGRGWLDMKSSLAVVVEVFLHLARDGSLPAHLVLLATADEEAESRGLRTMLPRLKELLQERGLKLKHVINADYSSPAADKADERYIHGGTCGKALIGLSVFGRQAHAGEPFSGLNASALAGHLAASMECNRKLLAGSGGEWLPPPSVLMLRDSRTRYDVMTPGHAELYFNLFHLGRNTKEGWRDTVHEIRRIVRLYDREQRLRYNRIARRTDLRLPRHQGRAQVIDFATLIKRCRQRLNENFEGSYQLLRESSAAAGDAREQGLALIRGLYDLLGSGEAMVVVSLLEPYYPARDFEPRSVSGRVLRQLARRNGLTLRRVYPYISDMSYFCFDGSEGDELARQAPLWFSAEELELYRSMSAPVCNIGSFGYGAHSAAERVDLGYVTQRLPWIILDALRSLAN